MNPTWQISRIVSILNDQKRKYIYGHAAVSRNYELERDKPMPSKIMPSFGNLHFMIRSAYGKRYRILPELSIVISSKEKVPDIAIYPHGIHTGEDKRA